MSTCKRSGRVSVNCWGWISHEGGGILHRIEGHLDDLQYQHILQNLMVPSVRMLYTEDIIHLQQDHSSIHDSLLIQEWLSWQADVKFLDRPPRAPDMNRIEKMWGEVKRKMQEPGRSSRPEIAMSYRPLCQTRGIKLLCLRVTFDH
jgi:hypothetical protein